MDRSVQILKFHRGHKINFGEGHIPIHLFVSHTPLSKRNLMEKIWQKYGYLSRTGHRGSPRHHPINSKPTIAESILTTGWTGEGGKLLQDHQCLHVIALYVLINFSVILYGLNSSARANPSLRFASRNSPSFWYIIIAFTIESASVGSK